MVVAWKSSILGSESILVRYKQSPVLTEEFLVGHRYLSNESFTILGKGQEQHTLRAYTFN